MKPLTITVVIPALDEEGSLPAVLADLPPGVRAIVVDNGSTDGTVEVARAAGATVVSEPRRGYGSAVQAGFRHLAMDPPDVVVVLDADHADRPDLLERLLAPIRRGEADLVLSDRTDGAEPGSLTPPQRFGNALAVRLIWLSTGRRYRDMGPFRAMTWAALQAMDLRDPTWGWNVEMQMRAVQRGLRVVEVPVPYRARRAGDSKISGSIRGSIRAGGRILWAVWRYRA